MRKKEIKVSVIMACYNAEKFIEESIKSILNQTEKEIELIIIDDSSSDNSLKIIKRLMKRDLDINKNKIL